VITAGASSLGVGKIFCDTPVKLVAISDLRLNPNNRNKHPEDQIKRLAKILKENGWRYPVKVSNLSGVVSSGHGRIEAAKINGWTHVPVQRQDYASQEAEYADAISDNAIASWAELDLSGINSDIGELGPDFDIDLLGIKDFVLEPAELVPQCDEDEVPEHVEPKTKRGDIYQLGRHRLMCGDSTSIDDVERLMGDEKADLLLTDPPYGVSYVEKNAAVNGGIVKNAIGKEIKNDSHSPEEMNELWFTCLSNAHIVLNDDAAYYIASPQVGDLMMMMTSIIRAGFQLKHMLAWVKQNFVFGRCDYHYQHEPILYGWKNGESHNWYGDRKQCSVLKFDRPYKSDLHPTTKPVELFEYLALNSTKSGDKILDLFAGSGTSLIVAEKNGRTGYGMELDPKYCDVIVARWEKYTGKKAELVNAG
jgi:site-specific DNA-methyltransferase (adenine-specific)